MTEGPIKIGYARVSTDDQDMALQIEALTRYGCHTIHQDHASGGTMKRRGLATLVKTMRKGDIVVVWKLDRLGRTLTGVIEMAESMTKQGIELVSLTEKIETASPMGKAFFQIALVFAELERNLISERTKAGIKIKQAQGVKFGQPHSIQGYPERLAEARKIVEEGVENITAREALERLNAVKTKSRSRPIKATATWYRWVKEGCPGVDG